MNDFAFGRMNYTLLAVGVAIILLGYMLMAGHGSNENEFDPEIFSAMRIRVAPIVCLVGFVVSGVAVVWREKKH